MTRRIAASGLLALAITSLVATIAHATVPLSVSGSGRVLNTYNHEATLVLDGVSSSATDTGTAVVAYHRVYANPIHLDCVRVVVSNGRRVLFASGRDPATVVGPDAHADRPNFFLKVVMQRGKADWARFGATASGARESCGADGLVVRPVLAGRFLATG